MIRTEMIRWKRNDRLPITCNWHLLGKTERNLFQLSASIVFPFLILTSARHSNNALLVKPLQPACVIRLGYKPGGIFGVFYQIDRCSFMFRAHHTCQSQLYVWVCAARQNVTLAIALGSQYRHCLVRHVMYQAFEWPRVQCPHHMIHCSYFLH